MTTSFILKGNSLMFIFHTHCSSLCDDNYLFIDNLVSCHDNHGRTRFIRHVMYAICTVGMSNICNGHF